MKHINSFENFELNESYSTGDKEVINKLVVDSIKAMTLSGNVPANQILNAKVINSEIIEIETEFETIQYKIHKITS